MAQQKFTIDLTSAVFPMLSEEQTSTVIGDVVGKSPAEKEKVGVAYCHNVLPTKHGLESVGYLQTVPAPTLPANVSFLDVRTVYGTELKKFYLAWTNIGTTYVLPADSTTWRLLTYVAGTPTDTDKITVGTVNGVSYIYYSKTGAYVYNEATGQLRAVTLTGLIASAVLGVTAASGYLVAYTDKALAWSSTLDPTDFTPSTVTGAGGGNLAGIQGSIKYAVSCSLGVLVHTSINTLAGVYTGNSQYPFKFREVDNSKGAVSLDLMAYEANAAEHFVYSASGLCLTDTRKSEPMLPEVTDFLAGRRFETFNESTQQYEITDLAYNQQMKKKIKYVGARYLVISYGLPTFTYFSHALVYDLALNKLGKLKIDHADVIEYSGAQTELAKEIIGMVLPTGEIKVADTAAANTSGSGVLILGKLKVNRTRLLTLLKVDADNVETSATLTVDAQVFLDNKNPVNYPGTLLYSADKIRSYGFNKTGDSVSLMFIGRFNLVTVLVTYKSHGKR